MGTLFTEEFLAGIEEVPTPSQSFVVTLCQRNEPAILAFKEQIDGWFGRLREDAQDHYRERLQSLDNQEFFQAFTEMVLHELALNNSMKILTYPDTENESLAIALPNGHGSFAAAVQSFIPEIQVRGSMRPFRRLLRELGGIEHRFLFSVYLKRWLPFDFDPQPIRRALEVWLNSLEDTNWEGKYAEYRDDHIHLEFSILDRLRQPRTDLVKFRITPLRTPHVLIKLGAVVEERLQALVAQAGQDTPLVLVLFGNEEWDLPANYLEDFLYNKANFTFNWTTRGGRTECVKRYQPNGRGEAIFAQPQARLLSAVLMIDKTWERDRAVFSMRVYHNPWCEKPLPVEAFDGFAQMRPYPTGIVEDHAYLGWDNLDRVRFLLP